MILYSRNGDFLGIGKDELSFLGYEDLDEFRSMQSDVADLFVNKPGYIFKFKNFSWIDYALHSGAPKKSVIIKLRSGSEVEVPLKIKELFLYSPTKNEELYYTVEFTTNSYQNNNHTPSQPMTNIIDTPNIEEEISIPEPIEDPIEPQEIQFEEDFKTEEKKEIAVDFDEQDEEREDSLYKLKIDQDILIEDAHDKEEKDDLVDLSNDFVQEYDDEQEPTKLKVNFDDTIDEETSLSIDSDYVSEDEHTLEAPKSEVKDFDLLQCVDELGLDISLACDLITEYMESIETTIPTIESAIDAEDKVEVKKSIYELKGSADILQISQISDGLENIITAKDITSQKLELEKFQKIVAKIKGELL